MAQTADAAAQRSTVDPDEIAKFSEWSEEWWDATGKFRPLHRIAPLRIGFVRDRACKQFGRDAHGDRPLEGLTLADIGCGGGLVSEPMARLGAEVLGVDAAERNIAAAQIHADGQDLPLTYRAGTAEGVAAEGQRFDIVLALEIVEHVADIDTFLETCAQLVKPGGLLVLSTINRTARAFALAIVGAEYVLRWLPRGTHDWRKFVTPKELRDGLAPHGMTAEAPVGMSFNPLADEWNLTGDSGVNYLIAATKTDTGNPGTGNPGTGNPGTGAP